jgi:hypothetical protein
MPLACAASRIAVLDHETNHEVARALTSNQAQFVNMLNEHLTARGIIDTNLLYESPFT